MSVTIPNGVIGFAKTRRFEYRKVNNVSEFLNRSTGEIIQVDVNGNINTFSFVDGDRLPDDVRTDEAIDILNILRSELNLDDELKKPVKTDDKDNIQDKAVIESDKRISEMFIKNELSMSDIVDHKGTIAALIMMQKTCPEYIKTRKGKGGDVVYVDGQYMTRALNLAFAFDWSFEIKDTITDVVNEDKKSTTYISVLGKLTVHVDEYHIVKEQWGSQELRAKMEIGDARKAAATDALKKCASMFGIAADVYSGEV